MIRPAHPLRFLALAAIVVFSLLDPATSSAQQYVQTAVAFVGDPAPGTGGGTYSNPRLRKHAISASGDVAFESSIAGGSGGRGVFVDSKGTDRAVAVTGDLAPGGGGATFTNPQFASLNSSGDIVFTSTLSGGTGMNGIYVEAAGVVSNVVMRSEPAPDTNGAVYTSFSCPSINDSGEVAFDAFIFPFAPGAGHGLFVRSGGGDRLVAIAGDPVPGTAFTFLNVGCPFLSNNGDVAFRGQYLDSGTLRVGFFVDSGGTNSTIALFGDAAPGTGGGTLEPVGNLPDIDANGNVTFRAVVSGGTAGVTFGLFKGSGGVDSAVALSGGPAPASLGGTFTSLDIPGSSPNGDVVFPARVSGGTATAGLFVSSGSTIRTVIRTGDLLPGTGGGTYAGIAGLDVSVNDALSVAYTAGGVVGTFTPGLFRATLAPPVPSLGPYALGWASLALFATSLFMISRVRASALR